MGKLTLTILFALALIGTTYFLGKLATWMVYKIAQKKKKKEFTKKDILIANITMFISIVLWCIVFYNLI